jgi:hypothetical protein
MMELTGRAPLKSPGAPSLRRDVERCVQVPDALACDTT